MSKAPCDMEFIVGSEEVLEAATQEDFDGGVIVLGFKNGNGMRYIGPIKDRYAAAGHLLDIAQYILSDDGEGDDDDDDDPLVA